MMPSARGRSVVVRGSLPRGSPVFLDTLRSHFQHIMTRMRSFPLALLLSAPLVAAWIPSSRTASPLVQVSPSSSRLFAFQVPTNKNNNKLRPRNSNDRQNKSDNSGYEPYDWENDRLEFVDKESERPWKIDEYERDALTIRRPEPPSQPTSRLARWNPFARDSPTQQVPQPPIHSRARLSTTDAGTLIIDLPATGIDSKAISSGVFGTLWFSAIVPATFAGGFATAAFLLPFWLAGGLVAKNAIVDPFVKSQLTLGQYAWSLTTTYANNAQIRQVDGSTQDLRGASVEDLNIEVNGRPFYEIKLHGDKGVTGFGNGLEPDELEYLSLRH
jgi:hypothetical protein